MALVDDDIKMRDYRWERERSRGMAAYCDVEDQEMRDRREIKRESSFETGN